MSMELLICMYSTTVMRLGVTSTATTLMFHGMFCSCTRHFVLFLVLFVFSPRVRVQVLCINGKQPHHRCYMDCGPLYNCCYPTVPHTAIQPCHDATDSLSLRARRCDNCDGSKNSSKRSAATTRLRGASVCAKQRKQYSHTASFGLIQRCISKLRHVLDHISLGVRDPYCNPSPRQREDS